MKASLIIAHHDLKLSLNDRSAILWMFVLPLVFAVFFGLVMSGDAGSPQDPKAHLTVVDEDQSALSRAFVASLESERLSVVEIASKDKDSTDDKTRTLVIPNGFANEVLDGEQVVVHLEKEPGTSPQAALVAQARITAAIARLIGQIVELSTSLPEGTPLSSEAIAGWQAPPDLITVASRFAGKAARIPDGFSQSVPGNAVMFVMLVALTYGAASISGERTGGQLRRLATAPLARHEIVIGKLLGRFSMALLQVSEYVLVGMIAQRFFGIELGNLCAAWVILVLFALAVAPVGLVFGGLFTDPDRAASVGVILTMVMAAFGGCWWPLEMVSPSLQKLAFVFPSGWAMQALHGVISYGKSLPELTLPLLALAGFTLLFTAVAARTLRYE